LKLSYVNSLLDAYVPVPFKGHLAQGFSNFLNGDPHSQKKKLTNPRQNHVYIHTFLPVQLKSFLIYCLLCVFQLENNAFV